MCSFRDRPVIARTPVTCARFDFMKNILFLIPCSLVLLTSCLRVEQRPEDSDAFRGSASIAVSGILAKRVLYSCFQVL